MIPMTTACLVPTLTPPLALTLQFPLSGLDLLAFRGLTPIGVQTDLAEPVAPGMRHGLELTIEGGPIVAVTARALCCRPVQESFDCWRFIVDWDFETTLDLENVLSATLAMSGVPNRPM